MGKPQSKEEVIIAQNGGGNADEVRQGFKGVSLTELALIILIVILALMIAGYIAQRCRRAMRKQIVAELSRRRNDAAQLRV